MLEEKEENKRISFFQKKGIKHLYTTINCLQSSAI